MQKLMNSWMPKVLAITLVMVGFGAQAVTANAAGLTELSDNLTRLKQSGTAADHEIFFKTPTGLSSTQTMLLTFSANFGISSIVAADLDLAEESSGSGACSARTYTEKPIVASGATSSQFNATLAGQVITFTSGGASATITATKCVRIRIGLNATSSSGTGPGTHQITNPTTAGSDTLTVGGGTFADSGTTDIAVIADDQVAVTATVSPSITFSLSTNSIQFGTLDAADDRFATTSGGSSSSTVAHTLSAGTNATSGYVMYVKGDTLTSGVNTITAPAGPSATTVGSEQFGLNLSASGGSGTVDTQYGTSSQYGWGATASVQDNVASASGTTASTTYSATYVANIASNTEAGAYTATLTYTATASF